MIGKTISHYKIIEKLGGGGMGVVYKAIDTKLDRTVALKFFPEQLNFDNEAEKRFISEAKATSSLDHPNICTIHDINKIEDGQFYIVMGYYTGETLKKKVDAEPLQIDTAINYATQIATGLSRAHEAGIIHRDIKPANIMITDRDEAKILDFGLAKTLNDPSITKLGSTVGTVSYMSPEQTKGDNVDHRTDIWSLGVVLYEMLSGELPFKGDYEQAIIYSILNERPAPLHNIRDNVPADLEEIILKTISKNPDQRYNNINELLNDLINCKEHYTFSNKSTKELESPGRQRKLVAIMFTDMVGYSALTQKNESLAIDLLEIHRKLLRPIFLKHSGREVESIGDAFFVEFNSAVKAASCAIEIQKMLHERNLNIDSEKKIILRIGLHVGDVVHIGKHVHGDGVNIAARLEPLSAPGGICLSEDVVRQIQNKIEFPVKKLGAKKLKNIESPVDIYSIVFPWDREQERGIKPHNKRKILAGIGTVILLFILVFIIPPGSQFINSLFSTELIPSEQHLLVLPLTNIGGDPGRQAFCDGLMETLSSKLTQIERFKCSLFVVPASEVIRNKIKSPNEAYQMYGVNLAVTGSLQFLNDLFRLTLNLVDAENLRQLNSSVIDIKEENIFSMQDKSVIKLLEMLHIEIEPELEDILKVGGTGNTAAYEYYVQGRGYLQRYENIENIDEAIKLFELSTNADTLYSLAYAGLGESYWRKYEATKNSDLVEIAIEESERAFIIDSLLAPVNVTLGMIYSGTGRYDDAVEQFNRALSNDPSNAAAYRGLAKAYESLEKNDDAESTFTRAIKLKPGYWAGYNDLGVFYYKNGRYEDAIEKFKMVIKLTPDNYRGYNNLGGIYYMLERWGEARDMFEQSLIIRKSYNIYSNLGTLYYIEGNYEDAVQTYEQALELNDNDYLTWGNLAAAYYGIPGKKDKAMETYKRAIEIAEEQLKINPNDPNVISILASYYADVGDETKSLFLTEKSLEIAPDNVEVIYRRATTYERLGNREKALFWIVKAIEKGYSRSEIENQPELKELVADERYKRVVENINNKN